MWVGVALSIFAALREGMHFEILSPSKHSAITPEALVLWVNGGPVSSVSYISDDALQRLSERSGLPIAYFDWCGSGRSTCAAASDWSELQGQAREVMEHVRDTEAPPRRLIVSMYSAGALSMPRDALKHTAAIVYLNPVTDLYSSLATRRRCVREKIDMLVSVLPYRIIDALSLMVCSGDGPISLPSPRGIIELSRQLILRERVMDGYTEAVLRAPESVAEGCVFVAVSERDKVISRAKAIAFHERLSMGNDTFVEIPGAGHYPVSGDCADCGPIATLYMRAVSRCVA